MSDSNNGPSNASPTKQHLICPHTGQLIVEKMPRFMGMSLKFVVIMGMITMTSIICGVQYLVEDNTARRMCLVQGVIAMMCGVIYIIFLSQYEKSKKELLKKGK